MADNDSTRWLAVGFTDPEDGSSRKIPLGTYPTKPEAWRAVAAFLDQGGFGGTVQRSGRA